MRMPGIEPGNEDPDGFMPRAEVIAFFERYAGMIQAPIRYDTPVHSVEPIGDRRYRIETGNGPIEAKNVVIATGFFQNPKIPALAARIDPGVAQMHTHDYRNPESLPPGAVLVVGSAMSGCQIAEELYLAGRQVYLSTGTTGRLPRRYRGKDTVWWLEEMGFFDLSIEQMPPGSTIFDSIPHLSGSNGGHTINLHQFARDGVTLLGRLQGIEGSAATLAPNLHDNLASADGFEQMGVQMIDGFIQQQGLDVPIEELPNLRDGFDQPIIDHLDLAGAGITTIVWGTGYRFDYSLVKLPVFDKDGFPIQDHGVSEIPGLYFAGIPWMPSERSGSLIGVDQATRHVVAHITSVAALA
jgi:putative flavoprotein involved in K+ transport